MPRSLASTSAPLPPVELAERVGAWAVADGDYAGYVRLGAALRDLIESRLPPDWRWEDRRLLDFGCGAGRTLRHFLPLADRTELWGCDIDEPSIRWLQEHLSPPINAFVNQETAGLPQEDGFFDLIYAISVFSHITDEWSAWLLELHRVLKEDGLIIASFLGPGMSPQIAGEPWDESRVGMNVLRYGQSWRLGGPNVMISPWWLRAHWGRAFEIVSLTPGRERNEHGVAVLRKKPVTLTREDLERTERGEPREEIALRHQVRQLLDEIAGLRRQLEAAEAQPTGRSDAEGELAAAVAERDDLRRRLDVLERSKSWRLTAPLRAGRRRLAR